MSKTTGRKRRIVITTAAMLAIGGGAAFAYWTSSATHEGSAKGADSVPFTITSVAGSGGALSPGGAGQTVSFTVTNPATGNQKLTAVAVSVAEAAGATWNDVAGCSAADYSVGTPVVTTYGDLAPGAAVTGTVTITMNNLASNQDACKGATVPLHFVAS